MEKIILRCRCRRCDYKECVYREKYQRLPREEAMGALSLCPKLANNTDPKEELDRGGHVIREF